VTAFPKPTREPKVYQRLGHRVYAPPPVAPLTPVLRRGQQSRCDALALAQDKQEAVRSEPYRRLVAALPCAHCGIAGYSQAAHPNTGKGAGLKTDDRFAFPLCGPRPLEAGCHTRFDQGALFSKAARRAIEPAWTADTVRRIVAAGQWPERLPMLIQQPDGSYAP